MFLKLFIRIATIKSIQKVNKHEKYFVKVNIKQFIHLFKMMKHMFIWKKGNNAFQNKKGNSKCPFSGGRLPHAVLPTNLQTNIHSCIIRGI